MSPPEAQSRALVFVPGLLASEREQQRDFLIDGLCGVSETVHVDRVGPAAIKGASGVRLRTEQADSGVRRTLDVFEAYWGDLVHPLSEKPLRARVSRGSFLLPYWMRGSLFRQFKHHRFLFFNLVTGAILLLLWYVSTTGLLLALADEALPKVVPFEVSDDAVARTALESWVEWANTSLLKPVSTVAATYVVPLWVLVAILNYLVPVNLLVDVADFTKRFLTNEPEDAASPLGLRDKVRNRVRDTVIPVCASGDYADVTVVAHSFGCAVAVDVLADLSVPDGVTLRLVTLGSPLELLSARSRWLDAEIQRCATDSALASWDDMFSDADWFCTRTPVHDVGDGRTVPNGHAVSMDATLRDRIAVRTHHRYASSPLVVDALLTPRAEQTSAAHSSSSSSRLKD